MVPNLVPSLSDFSPLTLPVRIADRSMALIVQKYGGTSVSDTDLIKKVAARVVKTKREGHDVIAVVSALGKTTDLLKDMAFNLNPSPPEREMDALLSTGEQVSSALLAMAISSLGIKAVSFTGSQVGILTDNSHTKARIVDVKTERIKKELNDGNIVIVTGFQGVSLDNNITTLGRGGSDTTAVALAAKLKADVCEILTDVDGVYTADPNLVPAARKLKEISYEEMLEAAANGSKVLQLRAVEWARRYNVTLHVRSSFSTKNGTLIKEEDDSMEQAMISSISHNIGDVKVTIASVPDKPGIAAAVFGNLADKNINVDMILQNVSEKGFTDISFTVEKDDLAITSEVMKDIVKVLKAKGYDLDTDIAKISLIGAGMRSHPGVAATMFRVLAENKINIDMISTSSIKISCVIRQKEVKKAVNALHKAFALDKSKAKAKV